MYSPVIQENRSQPELKKKSQSLRRDETIPGTFRQEINSIIGTRFLKQSIHRIRIYFTSFFMYE